MENDNEASVANYISIVVHLYTRTHFNSQQYNESRHRFFTLAQNDKQTN